MSKELEKTYKHILMVEFYGSEPEYFEILTTSPYEPLEIDYVADTGLATGGVGRKSIETPVELLTKTSEKKISKIEKL